MAGGGDSGPATKREAADQEVVLSMMTAADRPQVPSLAPASDSPSRASSSVSSDPKPSADDPLSETVSPRADAGDDQIGQVGRQLTLNGGRSEPRGQIGYRWVQTAGPEIKLKLEEGYIFSFVPSEPGLYRFALMVALGSQISAPDTVEVTVVDGARPTKVRRANTNEIDSVALPALSSPPSALPLDRVVKLAAPRLPDFGNLAAGMARLFDDIGYRTSLYSSYADLNRELAQRLDLVLPADAGQKALWTELLFQPLSVRLIDSMLAEGLDLRTPQGQSSPLSIRQKDKLADLFRQLSEGFREAGPTRSRSSGEAGEAMPPE